MLGGKENSERGSNRSRVNSSFQLSSSFVSLVEYSVVKTEWSAVPSSSNTVKLSQSGLWYPKVRFSVEIWKYGYEELRNIS